MEPMEIK